MNTLVDILDRPIAFQRSFVTLTGSVTAALLLSQAVYWQKRTKSKDGWFYKTQSEWEEETGLTRYEQESARKKCKKYLKSDLRGVPATLYYKVDEDAILADLFGEKPHTGTGKSSEQDSGNPSNINKNTETTTETTQLREDDLQKISESANKEVDAILAQMKLSAGKSWTALPEIYQDYGKAFCAATGLAYHKKDLFTWIQAFDEWMLEGFPAADIFDAVKSYADDGKANWVSSPLSLTKKMRGMKVSRTVKEQQVSIAEQSNEPDWRDEWVKKMEHADA